MTRYRIKAYSRRERQPRGYVGYHRVNYQELQKKRWCGWQTLDREEVPSWAIIEIGAFGACDWRSKFNKYGSWGRDGIMVLHARVTEVEMVLDSKSG